jgi:hypothetical protein
MPRHHTIISGTGRAGTTFLVQLLTELGLDTGFPNAHAQIFSHANAGMESDIRKPDAPYIVKSPWLCDYLDEVLQKGDVIVDHAIIPMRDLYSAAQSRRSVSSQADPSLGNVPGGLWHTKEPGNQETVLTMQLYKLMHTLAKHDIPLVLLLFPRFVTDPEYLYQKIGFLLGPISYETFLRAFQVIGQPNLVHDFTVPRKKTESVDDFEMRPSSRSKAINLLHYPIAFDMPLRIAQSTWFTHTPFAMFIVDLLRPATIVELGTRHGVSYCAFCQAVSTLDLDTRCYAIDTWRGDPHAGAYEEDVLTELRGYHDPLYGEFSKLIQSTFDEALTHFPDGTIDLLHIDGYHTYEVVKNDFENWLPKMSPRGVILMHDTNVRERDYGVWRLWEELKLKYPHFDFTHGHGLGVLAVGKKYPSSLDLLLEAPETLPAIRDFFFQMGLRVEQAHILQRLGAQLADKEHVVRELSAQSIQKDKLLEGTLNSKSWKFAVALRKLRDLLLHPGSVRERLIRFLTPRSRS